MNEIQPSINPEEALRLQEMKLLYEGKGKDWKNSVAKSFEENQIVTGVDLLNRFPELTKEDLLSLKNRATKGDEYTRLSNPIIGAMGELQKRELSEGIKPEDLQDSVVKSNFLRSGSIKKSVGF